MPGVVFQQLLAEFPVAGQEEPVLRQYDARRSAFNAEFQTAVEKYGCQLVLPTEHSRPGTSRSRRSLPTARGAHVNKGLAAPGKQGCGLGKPLSDNRDLLLLLALLLFQSLFQGIG